MHPNVFSHCFPVRIPSARVNTSRRSNHASLAIESRLSTDRAAATAPGDRTPGNRSAGEGDATGAPDTFETRTCRRPYDVLSQWAALRKLIHRVQRSFNPVHSSAEATMNSAASRSLASVVNCVCGCVCVNWLKSALGPVLYIAGKRACERQATGNVGHHSTTFCRARIRT